MSEEIKVEGGTEDIDAQVVSEEKPEDIKQIDVQIDKEQDIGWREVISGGVTVLKNIASIIAILTAIGFVVIHVYIASFSTLFSYNFNLAQYISAGLSLLSIPFFMMQKILRLQLPQYEVMFIFISCIFSTITLCIALVAYKWKSIRQYFIMITFVWFIPLSAFLMYTYYPQIPRQLGGGQPANIILVFNDEQQSDLWGFAINPENPRLSQPLQMLIELNDGIMVRQSYNYPAVVVKNSVLQGFRDASRPIPTETPMPEPTASPTPSS